MIYDSIKIDNSKFVQIYYYNTNSKVKESFNNVDVLIHHLYYNLGIIMNNKTLINLLSVNKTLFPMYDIITSNIVLIKLSDLYNKIVYHYVRPINSSIHKIIIKNNKIKHINFLKNFNLKLLYNTFLQNIYEISPTTNELTTCIRPSFLPIFKHIDPYYTKTELIFLSLNADYSDKLSSVKTEDIDKLCSLASHNDITSTDLLEHQLYIKENKLDSFIKYYSFIGSMYINHYLRFQSKNFRNIDLERNINNFIPIVVKSPAWNKSYFFYRWIRDDNFLTIGLNIKNVNQDQKKDIIWLEKGFISASRNPFLNLNEMHFGFILIKIKIPKNTKGCGLAIEYYSHFPQEQEIIFPPSKFKVNKSSDIIYYHPDKKINKKILVKYEFEWLEHLTGKNSQQITSDHSLSDYLDVSLYKKNEVIHLLDKNYILEGNNIYEKLDNFYNYFNDKFYYILGKSQVMFLVNKIKYDQTKESSQYFKYFYVNLHPDRNTLLIDKELFITLQDWNTGEIIFFIEISFIISLNYYKRYNPSTITYDDYDDIINMVHFISILFNISEIIIHPEFQKFSSIFTKSTSKNSKILNQHLNNQQLITKKHNLTYLYVADCFYYNELLFLYFCCDEYKSNDKFTNYLLNNKKILPSLSKKTIDLLMLFDLHQFINDFKTSEVTLNSNIDKICILSNKIIKLNNKAVIKDIYKYLFYNYYYLVDIFINEMLIKITNNNLNNILFTIKNDYFIYNYNK